MFVMHGVTPALGATTASATAASEIVTIQNGQVFELRNLTDRMQSVTLSGATGDLAGFVDHIPYDHRGLHGTRGWFLNRSFGIWADNEQTQGRTLDVPSNGKLVLGFRAGSHLTVLGDPNLFQTTQLVSPLFYDQILVVGGTVSFNFKYGYPSAVSWSGGGGTARWHRPPLFAGRAVFYDRDGSTRTSNIDWVSSGFGIPPISPFAVEKISITMPTLVEGYIVIFADFVATSGQPYRLTICGQRSYPPGMGDSPQPTQPTPTPSPATDPSPTPTPPRDTNHWLVSLLSESSYIYNHSLATIAARLSEYAYDREQISSTLEMWGMSYIRLHEYRLLLGTL